MFKNLLLALGSVLLCLLVLELGLRFFPVHEGLRTQPVNRANPIVHFEPDRTATWSRLPDFSLKNEIRSNNYGFINDQDYDPDGELPLLAVIGDSYVEAAMVPYEKTVHGRLAKALRGKWRVYSFGVSGAPLSQYLAFARFARDEFAPQKMAFVIVGNDFDESLIEYKQSPGFHYFKETGEGRLALHLQEYEPSMVRRLLRHSRLAMYLAVNLRVTHLIEYFTNRTGNVDYQGNVISNVGNSKINDSKDAVNAFFDQLPRWSGLSPKHIIFILDGVRPALYSDNTGKSSLTSYYNTMRLYFIKQAEKEGYRVVDMNARFISHYEAHGRRFEFPQDGHWNSLGHELGAKGVLEEMPELVR